MRWRQDRMSYVVDTHTHTFVSGHAYSTIREMILSAKEKGLEALAITEHAPEMPGTCHEFYFQNLKVVPRKRDSIRVYMGVELNILDEEGTVDLGDGLLKRMDIVIASLHGPCYRGERTQEAVMNAYFKAMENPYIDIIGHPDDGRFPVDYEALVLKAKETGTLLELNNSSLRPGGFRLNTKENDRKMLELCKKHNVMITLGSDAHVDMDVANFDIALQLLEECDFPDELIVNTSLEKLEKVLNGG